MIDPSIDPPATTRPPTQPAADAPPDVSPDVSFESEDVFELTQALETQHTDALAEDPQETAEQGHMIDPNMLDERRMSVRAYLYWASLLQGRSFPSVTDLDAMEVQEFRDNSVLLDFSRDVEQPTIRYVGAMLRDDAGVSLIDVRPADVPGRSLISRLTDHYLEIIANRAPVGFEAEFTNRQNKNILYRGILMPLSDDGYTINFIFGVMSWRDASKPVAASAAPEDDLSENSATQAASVSALEALVAQTAAAFQAKEQASNPGLAQADHVHEEALQHEEAKPEALMRQALHLAQSAAAHVESVDQRSRGALYSALAAAYGFHLQAASAPELFAQLVAEQGLSIQKRAPFTPTVKLVFGAAYDKTRLTEYAATLSYAQREGLGVEALQTLLHETPGGIKAIVARERSLRRAGQGNVLHDKREMLYTRLRQAPALAHINLEPAKTHPTTSDPTTLDDEFCLLLVRRSADGTGFDILSPLPSTATQLAQAVRQLVPSMQDKPQKS
jgi:hypothetical protein